MVRDPNHIKLNLINFTKSSFVLFSLLIPLALKLKFFFDDLNPHQVQKMRMGNANNLLSNEVHAGLSNLQEECNNYFSAFESLMYKCEVESKCNCSRACNCKVDISTSAWFCR